MVAGVVVTGTAAPGRFAGAPENATPAANRNVDESKIKLLSIIPLRSLIEVAD
jgi:hypothetical protein